MDWIGIAPSTVAHLIQTVLPTALTLYLLSVRGKSRGTWWLIAIAGLMSVNGVSYVTYFLLPEWAKVDRFLASELNWFSLTLASIATIGLAYTFLSQPFVRESRFVLGGALALALAHAGVRASYVVNLTTPPFVLDQLSYISWIVPYVWAAAVHYRKALLPPAAAPGAPPPLRGPARPVWSAAAERHVRAHWRFALLMGFIALFHLFIKFGHPDLILLSDEIVVVDVVAFAVYYMGLLILFMSYAPEPTSFQAKVVGVALAIIVVILSVGVMVLYPEEENPLLFRYIALAFGAVVLVLWGIPLLLRESITRPLLRLLDGVQKVRGGDLLAKVPVRVNDELGALASGFNGMTDALRAHTENLEGLVAERTAALAQSLEKLQAAQDQLVHQEKLASLGRLTAGIAHEIKNPLNFVNNFASLSEELTAELRAELEDARGAREVMEAVGPLLNDLATNVEKIAKHGRRADAIVRAMMDHARGGTAERRPVDLNALAAEHTTHALHAAKARDPGFDVAVETDLDPAVGHVTAAPQEIGRVVINLLSNAFDAVQERRARESGGAEGDGAAGGAARYVPRVTVRTRRAGARVRLEVADNGCGMAEEVKRQAFEPFFTTKPTGFGNPGLGLSMSHDVIRGHSGTLTVESRAGEGSTFTAILPAP